MGVSPDSTGGAVAAGAWERGSAEPPSRGPEAGRARCTGVETRGLPGAVGGVGAGPTGSSPPPAGLVRGVAERSEGPCGATELAAARRCTAGFAAPEPMTVAPLRSPEPPRPSGAANGAGDSLPAAAPPPLSSPEPCPEPPPAAGEFGLATSRRCTTAAPAPARVNDPAPDRGGSDDTEVTRTPEAGRTASAAGSEPPGLTASGRTPKEPPRARGPDTRRPVRASALVPARNGTAGTAAARPANGNSPAGRPRLGTARAVAAVGADPAIPALRSASNTARNPVPVKDGFCHVGRRAPNPASATPVPPAAEARRIGASPDQAATLTAGPAEPIEPVEPVELPESESGLALTPAATAPSARRPRNRSKNPTAQPSVPARVTRDAISPV